MQVEFDLTTWPPNSAFYAMGLSLDDGCGWDYLTVLRFWGYSRHADIAGIGEAQNEEVPASNTTGKYRLTRLGHLVSAYAWDAGTASWRTLISGTVAAPAESVLQIGWWGDPVTQPVRLTYDNLAINACAMISDWIRTCGPILPSAHMLANGSFSFTVTADPGTPLTVLCTTNLAEPLSNWTTVTRLTIVSSGQFQFTDPEATNGAGRFYRVRSP